MGCKDEGPRRTILAFRFSAPTLRVRWHIVPAPAVEASAPQLSEARLEVLPPPALPPRAHAGPASARIEDAAAGPAQHEPFVLLLAHEMRAPLCAIVGLADLLLDPPAPLSCDEQRDCLQGIARAGDRLTRLLEECMQLCRDTAASLCIEPHPLDLEPLLRQAIVESGCAAPGAVEFLLHSPLPQVRADADRIVQVLVNLLSNARRYSPPGAAVRVEVQLLGGEVEVTVTDRGPGIEPGLQAGLFRPFARGADAIAARHPGLGIGLFLCRSIVERHGGRLGLESMPGRGTSVRFTLPVHS